MQLEPLFTGKDLSLVESLEFNAELKPGYDLIKSCLVWTDERPDGLTPEAYENLCDLLIARSFIHRGVDFSAHKLDPVYFKNIWERALNQGFRWTGFQRLKLSDEDLAYYEKMLSNNENLI